MGIISSKLAPVAVRLAWICQTLLDPRYSCIESIEDSSNNKAHAVQVELSNQSQLSAAQQKQQNQQPQQQQSHQQLSQQTATSQSDAATAGTSERVSRAYARLASAKSNSLPPTLAKRSPDYSNSQHQENRNRRAAQLRFKTRPSSFDAALIVRSKNSVIVASPNPSPLRRQNMRVWDITSSSGCSSDSASNSDSDSETELRVSENVSNEEGGTRLVMSAEEEEIFRLTVGRGHFSRSKKDRFLNHLRLEKRLNDHLSNEYFGMACKSHHRNALQRRHSGELHRII